VAIGMEGSGRGPPTLIFPCDFFGVLKMLDRAAIIALIGRIRRAMPRNADVMVDAAPAGVGGEGG